LIAGFWEDDGVQFRNSDYEGGTNDISLRQSQRKYIKFVVYQVDFIEFVRKSDKKDIIDQNWKTLI
jgi:hypothetical protein